MPPVPPDDIKRSPSGRVPKWVVDEAHGRAPTDLVPFRAPTSPSHPKAGRPKRRWVRTFAWVAGSAVLVVGALYVNANDKGSGTVNPLAGQQATSQRDPNRPPPGDGERSARLLPTVTSADSTSFRFSAHGKGSQAPVTWSPCRPIHYVVRPDHSPAEGGQLIRQAFATLSAATGLSFVDDGSTTEVPVEDREAYQKSRYGDHWAPVLVTWATADEVPDFGIDVLGEAGPSGAYASAKGDLAYVSGTVAFDAAKLGTEVRLGHTAQAEAVMLHELGHLVGLAHVNDPTQIMFPRAGGTRMAYGAGDKAGLAKLGSGPCQPDL